MLATAMSATLLGADGIPVCVEVHLTRAGSLPAFTVVGLPDTACREARDRVRSAVLSTGFPWPDGRLTVNLAPSGLRKVGAGLDLAIAVAVLAANDDVPAGSLDGLAFVGELGLDGAVRPVPGMLPLLDCLGSYGPVVAPASGTVVSGGGASCGGPDLRPVASLADVASALRGDRPWPDPPPPGPPRPRKPDPDLADVAGQAFGRRVIEVAAAGGHHLLMIGPPGAGKTMLASRLPGILPDLDPEQGRTVARVHSAAGLDPAGDRIVRPPYRAPHHTSSAVALVGGGTAALRPGELSCATHGVLFLDELGEFPPSVLDALRQPLEDGVVRISRAHRAVTLPADVQLVAAMNPCPCGRAGAPGACRCSPAARSRYARRLSGPLLDRFDLRVEFGPPSEVDLLGGAPTGESTATVAARVLAARASARRRGVRRNADLDLAGIERHAPLDDGAIALLRNELARGHLSPRGLRRTRVVALTIADLAGDDVPLRAEHIVAALDLRIVPSFGVDR